MYLQELALRLGQSIAIQRWHDLSVRCEQLTRQLSCLTGDAKEVMACINHITDIMSSLLSQGAAMSCCSGLSRHELLLMTHSSGAAQSCCPPGTGLLHCQPENVGHHSVWHPVLEHLQQHDDVCSLQRLNHGICAAHDSTLTWPRDVSS